MALDGMDADVRIREAVHAERVAGAGFLSVHRPCAADRCAARLIQSDAEDGRFRRFVPGNERRDGFRLADDQRAGELFRFRGIHGKDDDRAQQQGQGSPYQPVFHP